VLVQVNKNNNKLALLKKSTHDIGGTGRERKKNQNQTSPKLHFTFFSKYAKDLLYFCIIYLQDFQSIFWLLPK